jgi:hypothetical protein
VRIRTSWSLLGCEPERVDEQDAQGLDRVFALEAGVLEEDQGLFPESDRVRSPPRARQEMRDEVRVREQEAARRAHQLQQPLPPAHVTRIGHLDVGQERVHQRVDERRLVGEVAVERVRRDSQAVSKPPHRESLDPLALAERPRFGENCLG